MASEELAARNKQQTAANREAKITKNERAKENTIIKKVVDNSREKIAKGETRLTDKSTKNTKAPYEKELEVKTNSSSKKPYNYNVAKARKQAETFKKEEVKAVKKKSEEKGKILNFIRESPKGRNGGVKTYKPQSLDVVVIDESSIYTQSPGIMQEEWQQYRSDHVRDAFVLLEPYGAYQGEDPGKPTRFNTSSPYAKDDWSNPIEYGNNEYSGYYKVTRPGAGEISTDWFAILKPWQRFAGEIRIFIDNSGSMNAQTVGSDLEKFITNMRDPLKAYNKTDVNKPITVTYSSDENWATWWQPKNNLTF